MNQSYKYFLVVCGALSVVWCGALGMPFAQDDFVFLLPFEHGGKGMAALLDWRQGYFRPVSQAFFFRILTLAGRPSPIISHFIVFTLYFAAVGIYYDLVRRLTRTDIVGAFAAFIFGSRSAHFLAVAWLSAAQEVIMVIFALGAMRCVVVSSERGNGGKTNALQLSGFALLIILALLSKETAITLPLLIFALWLYFKRKGKIDSPAYPIAAFGVLLVWIFFRAMTGTTASYGASLVSSAQGLAVNVIAYPLMFIDINREVLRYLSMKTIPAFSLPLVIWIASLTGLLVLFVSALIKRSSHGGKVSNVNYASIMRLSAAWGILALLPALFHTRQFYGYYALLANGGWALFFVLLIVRIFDFETPRMQRTASALVILIFTLSLSSVWLQARLPLGTYQRAIRIAAALDEVKAEHPNVETGSAVWLDGLSETNEDDARVWRALGWGAALPFILSDASITTYSAFYPYQEGFDKMANPVLSINVQRFHNALKPLDK